MHHDSQNLPNIELHVYLSLPQPKSTHPTVTRSQKGIFKNKIFLCEIVSFIQEEP